MREPLATSAARRRALSAGKRAYACSLRAHGATQAQIGLALGISPQRVSQLLAKAERLAAQPRWHGQFPARALNFLIIADLAGKPEIEAAQAVARLTRKDLRETPNLGRGAIAALDAWLDGHGLMLRDEMPIRQNRQNDGASVMPLAL
jgi:predicted transcriptional regulator